METDISVKDMLNPNRPKINISQWARAFRQALINLNINHASFQQCLSDAADKAIAGGRITKKAAIMREYSRFIGRPNMSQVDMTKALRIIGIDEYVVKISINKYKSENIPTMKSKTIFNSQSRIGDMK